jgi:HEAT repeat protein
VVIKRSSAQEVASLLRDLESGDEVARETAVARLSVIGTRAVEGLLGLASSEAPTPVRIAALSALEAIGDPRALEPAFALLVRGEPALAVPAAAVLRGLLDSPRGNDVLDRLAAIAVDAEGAEHARLAALSALQALPPRVAAPIWERLRTDTSAAVRAAVGQTGPAAEIDPLSALEAASGGALPDDPEPLRRWLASAGSGVSLPVLHRLVEAVRAREAATRDPAGRVGWMTARAAAHLALAQRGSRVALYDLRETIEGGAPAPVEMLRALAAIGDRSCLEPIAAAYARLSLPREPGTDRPAPTAESPWWRQHLATAFRAIAARERLTERHAVVRQIRTRWPDAALDLFGPPRR